MTIETLIERMGSQRAVAEYFGVSQQAVSKWVRRGKLPPARQLELLQNMEREWEIDE